MGAAFSIVALMTEAGFTSPKTRTAALAVTAITKADVRSFFMVVCFEPYKLIMTQKWGFVYPLVSVCKLSTQKGPVTFA